MSSDDRPIVRVRDLIKHFPVRGGSQPDCQERTPSTVSPFRHPPGRGAGRCRVWVRKSTLGKVLIRLTEPTRARWRGGTDITRLGHAEMLPFRRRMQIIFQDPTLAQPASDGSETAQRGREAARRGPDDHADDYITELIAKVGLRQDAADKFPHEFQEVSCRGIGIARALAREARVHRRR